MSYSTHDTIAAIASPPGSAARGIVRVSGAQAREVVLQAFGPAALALPATGPACRLEGRLLLPGVLRPLSCSVYWWPGSRSYTGEPIAELHLPGAPPLVEAALQTVCAHGARLAEPGEFTLRAFLAGRLDLTQAEAVLGVIDAQSTDQLRAALVQLAGGLSGPLERLRSDLLDLLADLEAGLDFVEEDIEFVSSDERSRRLAEAATAVGQTLSQLDERREATEAPRIVLFGWPNVGKSSLFNALVGQGAALVSSRSGTTRDYLTGSLELGGQAYQLIDTAGIDAADVDDIAAQTVQAAAQRMTEQSRQQADLRLFCLDASRSPLPAEETVLRGGDYDLLVLTKCDQARAFRWPEGAICTSSHTRDGLDRLGEVVRKQFEKGRDSDAVASTALRCRESLRLALDALVRAQQISPGGDDELVAIELRAALTELGKVVGVVYTDDVLDRIFSRFCIGK